jgi:hypothetical protein
MTSKRSFLEAKMKSLIMTWATFGLATLWMNVYNVAALNSTSRAYCRVYPDPHFTTVRKKLKGRFIFQLMHFQR